MNSPQSANVITLALPTLAIDSAEFTRMLEAAAEKGAEMALDSITSFNYKEACKRLGISYNTLQDRLTSGKIHAVDGRISAAEIRRYLAQKRRD